MYIYVYGVYRFIINKGVQKFFKFHCLEGLKVLEKRNKVLGGYEYVSFFLFNDFIEFLKFLFIFIAY